MEKNCQLQVPSCDILPITNLANASLPRAFPDAQTHAHSLSFNPSWQHACAVRHIRKHKFCVLVFFFRWHVLWDRDSMLIPLSTWWAFKMTAQWKHRTYPERNQQDPQTLTPVLVQMGTGSGFRRQGNCPYYLDGLSWKLTPVTFCLLYKSDGWLFCKPKSVSKWKVCFKKLKEKKREHTSLSQSTFLIQTV